MEKISTFFEFMYSKSTLVKGLVVAFLFSALFMVGCYEWRIIIQPESAPINSYFDVYLSAQDDGNPDNDWSNADLVDIGLFGVMIPAGWSVQDSIPFNIVCTDPSYNNDGILVYSAARSQTLQDSIPAPPGYFWWGAQTSVEASLVYFDSLYFEPRIYTGSATGNFFVRYAIGDVDYWDRNPADDISAPIPITIYNPVGVNELLTEANISLYPNPVSEQLTIEFKKYDQQVVDMSIFDVQGKMIMQETLLQNNNQINLNGLGTGLYFVKLQYGDSFDTYKIFVN